MGYCKGGKMSMQKRHLTLFGIPTLFTVLISVLVLSFATLSLLNTLNIKHSIERGNQILEDTYMIQTKMDIQLLEINRLINENQFDFNQDKIEFDRENQIISIMDKYNNLSLSVKVKLVQKDKIEFEIIEYRLTSGNNQDYTQDGDPVFGG